MLRWLGIVGLIIVAVVMVGSLASQFALDVAGISSFRVTPNVILPPIPFISTDTSDSQQDEGKLDSAGLPSETPPDASTMPEPIEKVDEDEESFESEPVEGEPRKAVEIEAVNVERGAPEAELERPEPPLDVPDNVAQEDPAVATVVTDPTKDELETINDEDIVKEPVKIDPPDEAGDSSGNEQVTQPAKPLPAVAEPDTVQDDDEPVKEPVTVDPALDEPEIVEKDIPVKQPLELDPPEDENEAVEKDTPVTEPAEPEPVVEDEEPVEVSDRVVSVPSRTRSAEDDAEPVEREEYAPEPVATATPTENPVAVAPPVENEPQEPEESVTCPLNAEARILPEVLDVGIGAQKAAGELSDDEAYETLVAVRLPDDLPVEYAISGVESVTLWVKLGDELYGELWIEGKPDKDTPVPGEFEFSLERMVYLLADRRGEVTLEVRGVVNGCEFVGTDTVQVVETVAEEPEVVVDETGENTQVPSEPVDDFEAEQTEDTESSQQAESTPVETVESPDQVGVLEPEVDESNEPEGDE